MLVHAPAPINTAPVAPPAPIEFDRLNHLVKSVDELEMSVRSMNCLQNGNIRWVWELAERTEPEMLRIKSFGWKSLRELNELLAEMGLAFGTKYSEEFKQLLIERTHGRGNPPASVAP
ncbi:MAG: DNA-directed RNA polymerase subunit alpha C-terminal domain-containing protein [Candidatus Uhrbacteria bacterium]|nr:DNA-directed RNA polymerase subunit alpha C-terminal domain-containing protein [Candidatus Uhrbacteria bacterium]